MDASATVNHTAGLSWEQRTWRWRVLIATYFAYVGYYLTRKVFTIAKPSIALDFQIDLQKVAHIWTAYLVAYVFGQFISSFVGRKWGPRVLLLGGLGLSIVFNVVFGFTNSYSTFLVFMFFNGLVQASGWAGSVGGVAHWLRRGETGLIMGLWSSSYLLGNALVKSVGGYLLGEYGWRWSFFGCTLLSFGFWWLVWFWQKTKPSDVGLEPIVGEEDARGNAVQGPREERITLRQYLQIPLNPVILAMGVGYFCIKFMRYSLDSWLPTMLQLQGLDKASASYYSLIFDIAGLVPVLLAGWAMDRLFHGRWEKLCALMGLGMAFGYLTVLWYGANPYALAFCYGIVGFMLYGPDTLLCGAASVEVAGNHNAVAVAGIVNGLGSIGSVFQEEVIGWLMRDETGLGPQHGIRNVNLVTLSVSLVFVLCMAILTWHLGRVRRPQPASLAAEAS